MYPHIKANRLFLIEMNALNKQKASFLDPHLIHAIY